jgi:hypothetical protein
MVHRITRRLFRPLLRLRRRHRPYVNEATRPAVVPGIGIGSCGIPSVIVRRGTR